MKFVSYGISTYLFPNKALNFNLWTFQQSWGVAIKEVLISL